MIVNSLGDWVVYGLGLMAVLYGLARLLPDMVVNCTLVVYRSYRRLQIGIEQAERELARPPAPEHPISEEPVESLLPVERGTWA